MAYAVKEIFYSLQGEGINAGRPVVFIRFSGCNLWSGRELDRLGAICQFCDTDFIGTDGDGGGKFLTAIDLANAASEMWPDGARINRGLTWGLEPLCVLTGGEPMLQVDQSLVSALHASNFSVAVETNGTLPVPDSLDWITVSPKAGTEIVQRRGQELKLVFPQDDLNPADFLSWDFRHFCLQPMDGPLREHFTDAATRYCLENPKWRLSLQIHKILGLR